MHKVRELQMGVATYTGHHRMNSMPKGIGMIPLGDRNRVKAESVVNEEIERESIDRASNLAAKLKKAGYQIG